MENDPPGGVGSVPAALWGWKLFFLPNQTRRLWAEVIRTLIADLSAGVPWKPVDSRTVFGRDVNPWFPGRNGMQRIALQRSSDQFLGVISRYRELHLQQEFACVLLALKCHKLRAGSLPASLAELVPEYLAEIPIDPWDGKPLRYAPEKMIIYSVGEDGRDAGGAANADADSADFDASEPTRKIGF